MKPEETPRKPMDPMLREASKIIRLLDAMNPEVRAWVLNYAVIKYQVAGVP